MVTVLLIALQTLGLPGVRGQETTPAPTQVPIQAATSEELLREIRALRKEVAETRQLKDQVHQLQKQLATFRPVSQRTPSLPALQPSGPEGAVSGVEMVPTQPGGAVGTMPSADYGAMMGGGASTMPLSGELRRSRGGGPAPAGPSSAGDDFPLMGRYRYNDKGTGPLGGGGYFHLGDADDEFVLNVTNQITIDGTFFDRQNMPTIEQGFNVPFARTFLYGNITKNWLYQIGTQGFLGQFNLLDMWMAYRFGDWMTVRFGKGLTPPLYEYYGFTPALEPVITNSPLFQLAGKRQLGVMFLGNLFGNRLQYWSGVTNAGTSFWYALNRNMEYNGAFDLTPFKSKENPNPFLEGMGFGIGVSAGNNQFALKQSGISFLNGAGEPTTNGAWVTSSGIPFAVYNPNVVTNGMRTRWSPHFYWYGRFSVLAEMINNSRELSDGVATARSTQWGYYVNLSYWLTGERDFAGNGFQGYSTIVPNYPFNPSKGQWGIGAWQLVSQFSELNIGRGDFDHGFINPTLYTNRLDQLMVGVNCWPNKYTRLSFDWVWTYFNNAIPINGPNPIQTFNTFWIRFAMFF